MGKLVNKKASKPTFNFPFFQLPIRRGMGAERTGVLRDYLLDSPPQDTPSKTSPAKPNDQNIEPYRYGATI